MATELILIDGLSIETLPELLWTFLRAVSVGFNPSLVRRPSVLIAELSKGDAVGDLVKRLAACGDPTPAQIRSRNGELSLQTSKPVRRVWLQQTRLRSPPDSLI
jgi:hypothetical protein